MVTNVTLKAPGQSTAFVRHSPHFDLGAVRVEPIQQPTQRVQNGGIEAIAEQLGISVAQVVAAIDAGELREIYLQRGVAPIPGSITDVTG